MTTSTIVDDVANGVHLEPVLSVAAGRDFVTLSWLREVACGKAEKLAREWHAEYWTETLVDYLQRGGVGRLERRDDGRVVFVFARPLPTAVEVERRVLVTSSTG
jgi:hypothetical protein